MGPLYRGYTFTNSPGIQCKVVPGEKWEFPKIRGTLFGVPIVRTLIVIFLGLYWGSPYFGKLPYRYLQNQLVST